MLLHQMFIETAKKYKDKMAIYDQTTKRDISYEQMLIGTLILKDFIKKFNEKHIGMMIPTSAGSMISVISIMMAGKIPVLINYSTDTIKNSIYAKNRCTFQTIITSKKLLDKLNIQAINGMIFIEDILESLSIVDKITGKIKSFIPSLFIDQSKQHDPAIILFTSGSEKEPKAVPLTHRNILHNINGINDFFQFTEDDIFMSVLPLFHVFGFTTSFWIPISKGCSMVAHANPLDYQQIAENIKKYHATCITATPTFYQGYQKKSSPGDFKSLRVAIAGADRLNPKLVDEYRNRHGVNLYEGYGTTETSPVISTNTAQNNKLGSIGKPLNNLKVKIVDLHTYKELPRNSEGKILVKGENVMNGYLGDIEETSYRVHDDWYDTGDMGILDDDGYLWHKGRLKRFVKIGGEMVSLALVENELQKLLPENNLCCVVEIPHSTKGSEIVAVLTEIADVQYISKELRRKLPSIAIPRHFVYLDSLPCMGSGKINFREVTALCQDVVKNKNISSSSKG